VYIKFINQLDIIILVYDKMNIWQEKKNLLNWLKSNKKTCDAMSNQKKKKTLTCNTYFFQKVNLESTYALIIQEFAK